MIREKYAFPDSKSLSDLYCDSYHVNSSSEVLHYIHVAYDIKNSQDVHFFGPEVAGLVLVKAELSIMRDFMSYCGDTHFYIIEINEDGSFGEFCFMFPSSVSWKELCNGGGVSYELFERPIRNYIIIGNSEKRCRFVWNDYDSPIQNTYYRDSYVLHFLKK